MGIPQQDGQRSGKETTTHMDLPGTAALDSLGAAVVLPRSTVDVLSAAVVVSGPEEVVFGAGEVNSVY